MTCTLLKTIAKLSIGLLLFMQLAVAAYACPGLASAEKAPCAQEGGQIGDAQVDHSTVLDPALPNLCLQHCQQGGQSDGGAPATLPVVALPLLAFTPQATTRPKLPAILQPEVLARTTAPPPSLLFCVFRA